MQFDYVLFADALEHLYDPVRVLKKVGGMSKPIPSTGRWKRRTADNSRRTAPLLVGRKEELDSTVWGFNNSQYSTMILKNGEKSERLAREFEKECENDDSGQE